MSELCYKRTMHNDGKVKDVDEICIEIEDFELNPIKCKRTRIWARGGFQTNSTCSSKNGTVLY